ncbi:hypothetical protein AXF42_Ash000838 [Apostasia shenzhenica]|uniref:Uncharacterized protein n=1 Tax=Apostasia shenzhenica TaxID=1088818 RepID=A0A2I0AT71_9ASPA|nr:hypothetical protein AXF42_Ash000838 [Apostasia shenzhenica]
MKGRTDGTSSSKSQASRMIQSTGFNQVKRLLKFVPESKNSKDHDVIFPKIKAEGAALVLSRGCAVAGASGRAVLRAVAGAQSLVCAG